eukprot:500936_1
MYNDIIDLAMDQQLIHAINSQLKIDYKRLPIWRELHSKTEQDIKAFEHKLDNTNCLTFDSVFNEPIGYFFIKLYLESQHSIDKAVFIRDVELFKSLHNYDMQQQALHAIYQTYCTPESPNRIKGISCLQNNIKHNIKNSSSLEISKSGSLQISTRIKSSELASEITEFSNYNNTHTNNRIFCTNNENINSNEQTNKIIDKNSISNSDNFRILSLRSSKSKSKSNFDEETDEMKEDISKSIFFSDQC